MRIESLDAQDYFGFRKKGGIVNKFGRIAVLIGKNNAGKSNVLRSLQWPIHFGEHMQSGYEFKPESRNIHSYPEESTSTPETRVAITYSLLPREMDEIQAAISTQVQSEIITQLIPQVISRGIVLGFDSSLNRENHSLRFPHAPGETSLFSADLARTHNISQQAIIKTLTTIRSWMRTHIQSKTIYLGGWRRMEDNRSSGTPAIQSLHQWKSPVQQNSADRQKFNRINRLFCALTGLEGADLIPAANGSELNIEWKGRYLSLKSFGDGFQHLLMIAFEMATQESCIFLLEEPETHLHPELQRRLMREILRHESHQFIITTHSPVMLDANVAESIHRVEHDGMQSRISECVIRSDLYRALDDIDARASDLLQANVVIWVEGPSDRVFLLRVLAMTDSRLVEGLHFQIVFYAGKLQSHLSFGSQSDLIDLLQLGRNVIMISDRDSATGEGDAIRETKRRLDEECRRIGGVSWITGGREIENYLDQTVVSAAYRQLLSNDQISVRFGPFDKLDEAIEQSIPSEIRDANKTVVNYRGHKVELMREFVSHLQPSHLNILDLRDRLKEVVEYINLANGIAAS